MPAGPGSFPICPEAELEAWCPPAGPVNADLTASSKGIQGSGAGPLHQTGLNSSTVTSCVFVLLLLRLPTAGDSRGKESSLRPPDKAVTRDFRLAGDTGPAELADG